MMGEGENKSKGKKVRERKVSFLDALAFGAASKPQRKVMNHNYYAKEAKREEKEGKVHDDADRKSTKSGKSRKSHKSGKSGKSSSRSMSYATTRKSTASRKTKSTCRSKSTKSHQRSSTRPSRTASYSGGGSTRRLLTPARRAYAAPAKPQPASKRGGIGAAIKTLANKLFGNDDNNTTTSHGTSSFTPSRTRPYIPYHREDEYAGEAEMYIDPNYNPRRVANWLHEVREDNPAASGVVLSDYTDDEGSTADGYRMANFPVKSEHRGSAANFCRGGTIVPDDGVSHASSRMRRRGF